jgi:hypothetical protein
MVRQDKNLDPPMLDGHALGELIAIPAAWDRLVDECSDLILGVIARHRDVDAWMDAHLYVLGLCRRLRGCATTARHRCPALQLRHLVGSWCAIY